MTDNDRITDPAAIRAWFEQDWAEQYQPAPGYLDPVRAVEAEKRADDAEARLELAEARVDQLTAQLNLANDTLRRRGLAVNATGATNDELRATIERVRAIVKEWRQFYHPRQGAFSGAVIECADDISMALEGES